MIDCILAGDFGDFLASAGGKLLFGTLIVVLSVCIVAVLYRWVFKYLFDFVVGAVLSVVTLPIVLVLSIISAVHIIKKEEYDDIFTETIVAGRKGKRTVLHSFTVLSEQTGELTSYGAFLRKTGLEQLPALWDLVLLRRSIVGVKALSPTDEKFVDAEHYDRFNARVGLLNSLVLRDGKEESLTYEEMFAWDMRYAQKVSLWTDLKVVFVSFLNFVRGDKRNIFGESQGQSYAQVLVARGEITAEDVAEAEAEDADEEDEPFGEDVVEEEKETEKTTEETDGEGA